MTDACPVADQPHAAAPSTRPGANGMGDCDLDSARSATVTDSTAWERLLLVAALTLGIFWAIESTDYEHPQWWMAPLLLTGILIAAMVLRDRPIAGWLVLAHVNAVGVADRVVRTPIVSIDVLLATKETIGVVARGESLLSRLSVHDPAEQSLSAPTG